MAAGAVPCRVERLAAHGRETPTAPSGRTTWPHPPTPHQPVPREPAVANAVANAVTTSCTLLRTMSSPTRIERRSLTASLSHIGPLADDGGDDTSLLTATPAHPRGTLPHASTSPLSPGRTPCPVTPIPHASAATPAPPPPSNHLGLHLGPRSGADGYAIRSAPTPPSTHATSLRLPSHRHGHVSAATSAQAPVAPVAPAPTPVPAPLAAGQSQPPPLSASAVVLMHDAHGSSPARRRTAPLRTLGALARRLSSKRRKHQHSCSSLVAPLDHDHDHDHNRVHDRVHAHAHAHAAADDDDDEPAAEQHAAAKHRLQPGPVPHPAQQPVVYNNGPTCECGLESPSAEKRQHPPPLPTVRALDVLEPDTRFCNQPEPCQPALHRTSRAATHSLVSPRRVRGMGTLHPLLVMPSMRQRATANSPAPRAALIARP